jgi:predicted transcriptional regulator
MSGDQIVTRKKWHYTRVENDIIDDEISFENGTDKLAYIILNRFANQETAIAFPGIKRMSKMAVCSERSIQYSLRRLEDMGLIKVSKRINETSLYEILEIPKKIGEKSVVQEMHQGGGATGAPGVVQDVHQGGATGAPELELINKRKIKDIKDIPVGEQKAAPVNTFDLPRLQKATAILFLQYGQKKELTPDDLVCLNLLFKLHTPHAIQQEIEKAFARLTKNGVVKYLHTDEKEYEIHSSHKLPIRYIYNSMKNWSSLRGTGGNHGNQKSRGNNERDNKNYESKSSAGFFV